MEVGLCDALGINQGLGLKDGEERGLQIVDSAIRNAVSYTHLTLPTNREV